MESERNNPARREQSVTQMPLIKYKDIKFRETSLALIDKANDVIAHYQQIGFSLTLRQLYYQMVSQNVIPNNPKAYDNLGTLITDARMAGLVDWGALEDRTRSLRDLSHWASPGEVIESAAGGYHNNLWVGQDTYVEVWIEKDALVGVIEGVCNEWDVPHFSCRGYTSATEMWNGAMRIWGKLLSKNGPAKHRRAVILHLGDHDPSGIDMTRDISDRIHTFTRGGGGRIEVKRIALNHDQVEELGLPPNPAKVTDSRAAAYMEEYGEESWELDALTPEYIVDLISREVQGQLDLELFEEKKEAQETDRGLLTQAAERWGAVEDFLNGGE